MNTFHPDETQALHAHAARLDAAKRRAEVLRRAAIDELGSALFRTIGGAWHHATRSLRQRAAPTTRHHPTKA
jgi:hypothetical protein